VLTRLRTIANKLIRELQRKLPTHSLFETYQKDFLFYPCSVVSINTVASWACLPCKATLILKIQRKLPTHSLFETYQKDFLFYQKVLAQQPKDKNKI
jgi:hypothetical protein